jgi:hypothetical protein
LTLGREAVDRPHEPRIPYFAIHKPIHQAVAALLSLLAMGSLFATRTAAQDQQSTQHPSSIRGTVINAVTGEPIGHALVYTPDNRFARLTDGEGHFEYPLNQIPFETNNDSGLSVIGRQDQPQFMYCCLQARKPGFLTDPSEEQGGAISLGSEPVIALVPEGRIIGRVSLPSSDATIGVGVEIYSRKVQDGTFRWVRGQTVRANSNGEFRFAELQPGEYRIVTHEAMDTDPTSTLRGGQLCGFPPVYFPGTVDFASASPIQLKPGQTFEADLSPARQPYYPVRIPVPDDVENAQITVSIQGHDSPGYSLGFNRDRHRIDGFLPNGTYLVSMESFGPNGANGTVRPNGATGTVSLTVAGGPAQGPDMVLSRHSTIQLNVTEEFTSKDWNGTGFGSDGKRTFEVHGPRLYLQAQIESAGSDLDLRGGRSIAPPAGPDDDTLAIPDVAPGRYRLRLSSGRGYVASATAGGVDLLQEPLVVGSGSASPVDIHLRDDFAEIDGSLTNVSAAVNGTTNPSFSGPGKSPALIYFVPESGGTGQYQQIWADPEGKFDATNVAPGKYLVLAFEKAQRDLPFRDADAMRKYEPKGQTVRLVPGQKEKLELQIISGTE